MRITARFLIACLLLTTVLDSALLLNAHAQGESMTDQQIQQIRDNCLSTNNTLNQLHVSDALLRVNMGQIYESVAAKLMDSFNNRVSKNGFSDADLVSTTKGYRAALDTFRDDYKTYEEQLSATLNIDCSKQPTSFYDAITLSRIKRDQVKLDVKNLDQYIEQYQSAIKQFEIDFKAKSSGASN